MLPVLPIVASLKGKNSKVEILFLGSPKLQERRWVEETGTAFHAIFAGKWRRYFDLRNISDLFLTFIGFLASSFYLLTFKPDIVFIKGGYVGVPVGLVAKLFGVPYILHESDSVMGAANRLLAGGARALCTAFPVEVYRDLSPSIRSKLIYLGLPVRQEFTQGLKVSKPASSEAEKSQRLTLLVMGGSQGARQINGLIKEILPELLGKFRVIHQAGRLDFSSLDSYRRDLPENLFKNYELYDFKPQIVGDIKKADLVVSRAGATAIFELATLKKPTIFIPLPGSANDHQYKNAKVLAGKGAARLLAGDDANPRKLLTTIKNLFANRAERKKLSQNIKQFARFDAAEKIATLLLGN